MTADDQVEAAIARDRARRAKNNTRLFVVVSPDLRDRFRAAALRETGPIRRKFGEGSAATVLRRLITEYVRVMEASRPAEAAAEPSRGARR